MAATEGSERAFRSVLRDRLGRRGTVLLIYGAVLTGGGTVLELTPAGTPPFFNNTIWGALWITAGLTCLVCAWLRPPHDATGFAAAIALLFFWGASDFILWLSGTPYIWFNTVIWWSKALHASVVAGWPEVATRVVRHRRHRPPPALLDLPDETPEEKREGL